jgi:uncharacterized membrane protein HdeD (DUF308 family)
MREDLKTVWQLGVVPRRRHRMDRLLLRLAFVQLRDGVGHRRVLRHRIHHGRPAGVRRAAVAPGWKWLYILIGIVSIVAGLVALFWPGQTFLVLSAIAGWLLLFYGIIDIVFAFSTRDVERLWWLQLITGIIMVGIGFWAISPDDDTVSTYRGAVLLVVWIGVAALFRGMSDIIVGFRLRSVHKQLEAPTAT